MVAAHSLSENIVSEIRSFGLKFAADDTFNSLLRTAGADDAVLAAVNSAKVTLSTEAADPKEPGLLVHLSAAGKLIRANRQEDAAKELSAALAEDDSGKAATNFVTGDLLTQQKRWNDAVEMYLEVFRKDPSFPEIETKLSYAYYGAGQPEEVLRHAKAALVRNPNNPSAHLNKGLALCRLNNVDGAKSEVQESLRLKPDFSNAYFVLGYLLDYQRDYSGAVAQYKKGLALKPDDLDGRNSLGIAYVNQNDFISAIREFREAKRLDPKRLDVRQNLGSALIHEDPTAAIAEFRELVAIAPDFPVCHLCLGGALLQTGRYEDAEREYRLASQLDPTNPSAHTGLGRAYETAKKFDEALLEYRKAEKLDNTFAEAYTDAGRVLLYKKDFVASADELKQSEELDPTSWLNHDFRGEALEASGDRESAIAEYKEALSLAPKEIQARLDLALAIEKKGDWLGALPQYHRAVVDEAPPQNGVPQVRFDAKGKLAAAERRFRQHLADLRSTGKASEAASVEARLKEQESAPNLDEQYQTIMQTSMLAFRESRFSDAEASAKEALVIAEKIQPSDARLPEAVGQLGVIYGSRKQYAQADELFKRQLALTELLYGAHSPNLSAALQNLGRNAADQRNFSAAEAFIIRAYDLNEKSYGENSAAAASILGSLAQVYVTQGDFPKGEVTLLRALRNFETLYGSEDMRVALPLNSLCYVYDQWGKPEKSEPCHARLVADGGKTIWREQSLFASRSGCRSASASQTRPSRGRRQT